MHLLPQPVSLRVAAGAAIGCGRRRSFCLLADLADKRMPLRAAVRISACCSPLSPIALRTAVMRLLSVDSDTMRPPQTAAKMSSRVTTRSRLRTR
jgi:hypothetical protein